MPTNHQHHDDNDDVAAASVVVASRGRRWLTELNAQMGLASRRLFQSQHHRNENGDGPREQLPDLWRFVRRLLTFPPAASSSPAAVARQQTLRTRAIRWAFASPDAQWLTRGAVESGATGALCHFLLQREPDTDDNDDDSSEADGIDPARRLVAAILLDVVWTPCDERRQTHVRECDWTQRKPRYYAMACAGHWETLLPCLTRLARHEPAALSGALNEMLATRRPERLVLCRFAQVVGAWRWLGTISDGANEGEHAQIMREILQFALQWSIFPPMAKSDARFDGLLMEKCFQEMQEFLFEGRAGGAIVREAMLGFIIQNIQGLVVDEESTRLGVFTATVCSLLGNMGTQVVSRVSRCMASSRRSGSHLGFIVGLVAHVDIDGFDTVVPAVNLLLDLYEDEDDKAKKHEYLFWVVYILVSRQVEFKQATETNLSRYSILQSRLLTVVKIEEFYQLPLHWMETIWRDYFSMEHDEVVTFINEATQTITQFESVQNWKKIHQIPFRSVVRYPNLVQLLNSHFLARLRLVEHDDRQNAVTIATVSRPKTQQKANTIILSEEHEESRQSALLLPEIMERICGFMSGKRLCRLATVCQAFSNIVRNQGLWRALYLNLTKPLNLKCPHGTDFEHDWKAMYIGKHTALRTVRRKQRLVTKKFERTLHHAFMWNQDDSEQQYRITLKSVQLCHFCGCDQVFSSDAAAKTHHDLHKKYKCSHAKCGASFTSATAMKTHSETHVQSSSSPRRPNGQVGPRGKKRPLQLPSDTRFACTHSGCNKSYKSVKWLHNHVMREHQGDAVDPAK